ncbi:J domain-containing protein [Dankookia sp. P2]|uniref:J domain-containing protein n=1 Tax=Dankookia sp. P2 TaxID=3423955 RepID=UPI003D674B6A
MAMPPDPYATLGLSRDATAEQIRAAYRKLAKQHHPDLNPGNKGAEDRFKAISAAHDLLSDPETRGRSRPRRDRRRRRPGGTRAAALPALRRCRRRRPLPPWPGG